MIDTQKNGPLANLLSSRNVMAAVFALVFGVLAVNGYLIYRNFVVVRAHEESVTHAAEVINESEVVFSLMKDAETGQRGFQIAGEEEYLTPYQAARANLDAHLERVTSMTRSLPYQRERLEELRTRINTATALLDEAIARRRVDREAAREWIKKGEQKRSMDMVRQTIGQMQSFERDRLADREKQAEASWLLLNRSFIFSTAFALVLVVGCYYFLRRYSRQQEAISAKHAREAWLKTHQAKLGETLRNDIEETSLARAVMNFCAASFGILAGNFYSHRGASLDALAGFGTSHDAAPRTVPVGMGLVGEAASQKRRIHVTEVPQGYLQIASSTGKAAPGSIMVLPILHYGRVKGVIELARFQDFTEIELELLELVVADIAASLQSAQDRTKLQDLLEETQRQAEELQAQQEELRTSNEELEARAGALVQTKNRLQEQQEELRQINEELDEKTRALERQSAELTERNAALSHASRDLEAKARELELSNQYKSEFLANMSHELRTPLNSLLLLSTLLMENRASKLGEDEVEYARTIYRSGNDLLNLINDILDLAKVEAGRLDINPDELVASEVAHDLDRSFRHLAEAKGLGFKIELASDLPRRLYSDKLRLEQILKNFLSNAIKFTQKGDVRLIIEKGEPGKVLFSVVDSGIGIPEEKLGLIFEAFQQVDGSTNRQFGGTGLGLTISRQLAHLLQGTIRVQSKPGEGSCFVLEIPERWQEGMQQAAPQIMGSVTADSVALPTRTAASVAPAPRPASSERASAERAASEALRAEVSGDVETLTEKDRTILLIEDDPIFAMTLYDLAHESGFKALIAPTGEAALEALQRFQVHGVVSDIKLPDVSGLAVLERIKGDPKTRHLPIHMISALDYTQNAMKLGAVGYLVKPVELAALRAVFGRIEGVLQKSIKRVLIVEDDTIQRSAIGSLLSGADIECDPVGSANEALEKIKQGGYDCMILDLRLPDMSGFELLEALHASDTAPKPPVIVYTGKDLTKDEETKLRRYSDSIIIKGARSPERLLDEVSLFLHRVEAHLPQNTQAMLQALREREKVFEGRKILLVDDDMRNVFALANVLDTRGLKVVVAKNGKEALERLEQQSDLDLVLMDIMMPVMNGFEAMQRIRENPAWRKLPIIALTAKAMRGDQDRCLEAGANDYLAKPIQLDRLLSLLRVWLPQRGAI